MSIPSRIRPSAAADDGAADDVVRAAPGARALLAAVVLLLLAGVVIGVTLLAGRPEELIVREIRAPRLAMALLGGCALGMAGLVLQEGLGNRLAVPEMLGVSAGASAVMCAVVVLGVPVPAALAPLAAFAGGMAAGLATWRAARLARTPAEVLLAGAAVTAAASSLVFVTVGAAGETQIRALLRYLQGSLVELYWPDVRVQVTLLLFMPVAFFLVLPAVRVLRAGDASAAALGARPERLRGLILLVAAFAVAVVVSAAGPVAWVGFLGPVAARALSPGSGVAGWLALSGVCGAVIVAAADLPARWAFAPAESPVGGWTGIVAAVLILVTILGGRR